MRPPFKTPALLDPATAEVIVVPANEASTVFVDGKSTPLMAEQLNKRTQDTRQMLLEILRDRSDQHDVSMYFWQNQITLDPLTRPRSHPKLTLDAEYSANPDECTSNPSHWKRQMNMLRSVFVHEQLHLFVGPLNRRTNPRLCRLVWELKSIPALREIPVPETLIEHLGPQWARAGTDLHIVINWLELQANKRFLGSSNRAKDLASSIEAYRDIYQVVIDYDDRVAHIMRQPQYRGYLIENC